MSKTVLKKRKIVKTMVTTNELIYDTVNRTEDMIQKYGIDTNKKEYFKTLCLIQEKLRELVNTDKIVLWATAFDNETQKKCVAFIHTNTQFDPDKFYWYISANETQDKVEYAEVTK